VQRYIFQIERLCDFDLVSGHFLWYQPLLGKGSAKGH